LRYSTCKYTVTLKPGLGSFKVIETDTNRSVTYDFLLKFHCNHGPISYRFRGKRRFPSKVANFPTTRVFCASAEGVPLRIGYRRWGQKLEWGMGLPDRERSLTISSAVWIQSINMTDGRTYRHRATAKTALTHTIARSKD